MVFNNNNKICAEMYEFYKTTTQNILNQKHKYKKNYQIIYHYLYQKERKR